MKKIKVIFPDGSIGEIDEKDLPAALAAGVKRYTDQPVPKTTKVTFADGSEGDIDESDYVKGVAAGAIKKKESIGFGTSLRDVSSIGIAPLSEISSPEVSRNPYAKVLEVVSNARPKQITELYQKYVGELESGDENRVKAVKDDIVALQLEKEPNVITPSDKQEIKRLTGVDDPRQQLEVLKARSGFGEQATVLSPLIDVDFGTLPSVANLPVNDYISKLEFQLGSKADTRWSGKKVVTVGGKGTTALEGFLNMATPLSPQAVDSEIERFNSESLNDSFSTGLESIKESNEKRYNRIVDAIINKRPIPTTDVVELTSIGSKILVAKNAQAMIDRSISSDEFIANQNAHGQEMQNNIYNHPDFLRSMMSDVISKHYEKDGTIVFSKWMVTDKEIDAVPEQKYIDAGLDPNNPEFKKQKEFLKEKEGWFPFQNAIAKDDLFREFRKGVAAPLEGIVSTVESAIAPDDMLAINRATQPLNVSEVSSQRGEYFDKNYGVWADAFNGLGQFSSQLALMYAGSAATSAAGQAIGGGTTASRLLGASRLQRLGNALVDNRNLYAQYGVPFIQSYGDYYKDALSKGANPLQAKMMAFTNASMEGVSETLFDNIAFGKQVAKDLFDKQNYEKIIKAFDRGILDDQAISEFRDGLLDVTKNTAKTFFKAGAGAAKEAFEEVPVALTNFVVDAIANPESVADRDVITEMKDSFLDGLVQFSIPSLLGLGGSLRQQFKDDKKPQEALMIAAIEHPYVVESINRLAEEGKISQADANRKIKIANTASQALQQLPATYADDTELSPLDREKYLSLSVQEKILEGIAKDGDKAQKAVAERKIDEITKQKELILNKGDVSETKTPSNEQEKVSDIPAKKAAQEKTLFQRAQESATEGIKLLIGETESDEGLQALNEQALDTPNGLLSGLNNNRELVTDIISQNSEAQINKSIDRWTDAIANDTATPEEGDAQILLLEEGLAKKRAQATTSQLPIGEKLTDDALDLIEEFEVEGAKPSYSETVVATGEKRLNTTIKKIAKENGVEIKEGMTARDVVAALKEKQTPSQLPKGEEQKARPVKLTEFEKEEMLSMLDNRRATAEEDPESASGIESNIELLDALEGKIKSGGASFTKGELEWLKTEADDFLSKAEAAIDADGNPTAKRDLPKIKRFVKKIDDAISAIGTWDDTVNEIKVKQKSSKGEEQKLEPVEVPGFNEAAGDVDVTGQEEAILPEGETPEVATKPRIRIGADEMERLQPPKTPDGGALPVIEDDEGISIIHAKTAELREKFEFDQYEKDPETFEQWDEEASRRIKNGELPPLLDRLRRGVEPSKVEQRMMGKYIAHLEAKTEVDPTDANLSELYDAIKLSDVVGGREVAKSLVARKGTFLSDDSLANFFMREMESLGVDKLTAQQKERVKKEWDDLNKAKEEFNKYVFEKEAEMSAKKAQAQFDVEKKSSSPKETKKRKTAEEFFKERDDIFKSIRDKLKKAREETSATLVPYAKELIAISPDVLKLMKSYAGQAGVKFLDFVDEVHGLLKDDITGLQKEDVIAMVAGDYSNRTKPTRNEIMERLRDWKSEALLLNKYDQLEKGEEPSSEVKKVRRNKELTELREQIKHHDLNRLAEVKKQMQRDIEKLEQQLKDGDYSKSVRREPVELDKEGRALEDNLLKLKNARETRLMIQEFEKMSAREKALKYTADVLNIPRTLMTILDFSAMLRQGVIHTIARPSIAFGIKRTPEGKLKFEGAAFKMIKAATSQKEYDRWFAHLRETDRYQLMRQSKLSISDIRSHEISEREEAFMTSMAEKIPIIGKALSIKVGDKKVSVPGLNVVKGSERAYTMFLNKMRVDLFNKFADSMIERGMTIRNSPEQFKAMADYVNNATGRGSLGYSLNKIAPLLNSLFFSPRLIASRLNMLTYMAQPRFWKTLPREVRADYFKSMAKFIGIGMTVLALSSIGGDDDDEVEVDPRSPDFGKIRRGNTRWDIWGGFQPYIRVAAQVLTGERKSANTGKIYDLGPDKAFGETRFDVLANFARGKLAPVPGAVIDLTSGRTQVGEKIVYQTEAGNKQITIGDYIKNRMLPLTVTGIEEAVKDQGIKALFTAGIPSVLGVGVQTYETSKSNKK